MAGRLHRQRSSASDRPSGDESRTKCAERVCTEAEEALKLEEVVLLRRARGARASVCGRGDLEVADEERPWKLRGGEDLTLADRSTQDIHL
jgi:hypothetical protein